MVVIFIRTIIIYGCLFISMRLMGKRQIGQLDISDLITTLLISEIASLPIENPDIPIIYSIIPIVTLLTFEVSSSTILSRSQFMKNFFSTRPSFLIKDGEIDQRSLSKNRISLDELISKLREQGMNDLGEIKYAIIEPDGQLSVVPFERFRPATPNDIGTCVRETGIMHVIIANGRINEHGLSMTEKNEEWVNSELSRRGIITKDVFLMTLNDADEISITKKATKTEKEAND